MTKKICENCGKEYLNKFCPDCGCAPKEDEESINQNTPENDSDIKNVIESESSSTVGNPESAKTDKKFKIFAALILSSIAVLTIALVCATISDSSKPVKGNTQYFENSTTTTISNYENVNDDYEPERTTSYQMSKYEFENLIKEQFSDMDYVDVGFRDGNVFSVGFCINGTALEVGRIKCGTAPYSFWAETKSFVASLYIKVRKLADENGFEDYNIGVNVINDLDHSKSLLVSLNGKNLYDCLS